MQICVITRSVFQGMYCTVNSQFPKVKKIRIAIRVFRTRQLVLYRESNRSAHVLLNLSNMLRKRDKMQGLQGISSLFAIN